MLTNTQIAHAWVVVAALNDWPKSRGRNLRPLVNADFNRIREARKKIQGRWAVQKLINKSGTSPRVEYYDMRKALLDRWMNEHGWHKTTRETYSSVLSIVKVWEQHGVLKEHEKALKKYLPGAELTLRHLVGYEPSFL